MKRVVANPEVVIAHPERQHAFQTAYAFQEGNIPFRFFTSIWNNPSLFPYNTISHLPTRIQSYVHTELQKRSFPLLQHSNVNSYNIRKMLPYIGRRAISKAFNTSSFQLWHTKTFDKWVAKRLHQIQPKIFIGYETACLRSFQICKNNNGLCVLDHTAQHFAHQQQVQKQFNALDANLHKVQKEIQNRKQKEIELADIILTPSLYAHQTFISNGIPEHKLVRIPYGVDLNVFTPAQITKHKENMRILFCGTPSTIKGILFIEQAIRRFDTSHTFVFAGSMTKELDTLIKLYPKNTLYVGYLQGQKLAAQYQLSDLFILPSLMDSFGLVALEAMACGIPALVTEHTGAKDLIQDGINGWIIPVGDSEMLVKRILWAKSHRQELNAMGKYARTQAENYSWSNYRANIRTVYTTNISANAN